MKISLRKSLSYYCFTVGLITFFALIIGGYSLWRTGSFNQSNISSIYESGLILEDIKKTTSPKEIKRLVQSDRVRESLALMKDLSVSTSELNNSFALDSYNDLMLDHRNVRNEMKSLISYPKQEMIIAVLNNKIDLFRNYVISNSWRTLTRMSNLMVLKTSSENVKSPGFFTERKLKSFIRGINQDLNRMTKITNDSVLGIIDKNDINRRIDDMRVETAMLKKYVSSLKKFMTDVNRFDNSYAKWINEIGPAITLRRIHLEKSGHILKVFFLGFVVFVALALIVGFFVERISSRASEKEREKFAFEVINLGLLPLNEKFDTTQVSSKFIKNLEKAREHFHHRISFGSVFQQALPFSSLLLDSNLNLNWANDLFFEQWNISDGKQVMAGSSGMSLSWDFLQQNTNLGEDDPVQLALKDGVAGIYQVQVMNPISQESLPFEMYVSPVEYARQKRIMIFFYPLRNMEETLSNQVQSITGPISRTLDELSRYNFGGEVKDRLKNDFHAAGISKLFEKFLDYSSQMENMQNDMHSEIDELDEQLREQVSLNDSAADLKKQRLNSHDEIQKFFKKCRQSVIELIELRYELEQSVEETAFAARNGQDKQDELISISKEALDRHEQSIISIDKMTVARDQIKTLKDQLIDHKTRLVQDLDHALVSAKRRGTMDDALEASLGAVKNEVKNIELVLNDYSQVTKQLDIILSKAAMLIERKEAPPIDELENELHLSKVLFERSTTKISELAVKGEAHDTEVVTSLKNLFDSYSHLTYLDQKIGKKIGTSIPSREGVSLS